MYVYVYVCMYIYVCVCIYIIIIIIIVCIYVYFCCRIYRNAEKNLETRQLLHPDIINLEVLVASHKI